MNPPFDMTYEEAIEIQNVFGKFMEVANPGLTKVFHGDIPESVLPYSKQKIEQSANICATHFRELGDDKMADTFEFMGMSLLTYTDDRAAIVKAYRRLAGTDKSL